MDGRAGGRGPTLQAVQERLRGVWRVARQLCKGVFEVFNRVGRRSDEFREERRGVGVIGAMIGKGGLNAQCRGGFALLWLSFLAPLEIIRWQDEDRMSRVRSFFFFLPLRRGGRV